MPVQSKTDRLIQCSYNAIERDERKISVSCHLNSERIKKEPLYVKHRLIENIQAKFRTSKKLNESKQSIAAFVKL